jgi:Ca-activated chloride channel family protein
MQVKTVVWLSAVGMTLSSVAAGWLASPTPAAQAATAAVAPNEPAAAAPQVDLPGRLTLQARVGHSVVAEGADSYLYFRAKADATGSRSGSLHATLLIDKSGSMRGRRLANALEAARAFVRRLRVGDHVTVMTYDAGVSTLVASTRIDDGSRATVVERIRDAPAGGSTCISCALEAGIRELESSASNVTHLLLLSDGEATSGEKTLEGFRGIARRAREAGIGISSIGVDVDYNEALLSTLAQLSNGRHHFVRDPAALDRAFDDELDRLSEPVATNVVLEVALAPGVELLNVFDREVERDSGRIRIRLGTFSPGDEKTLLLQLRLPSTLPDNAFTAADFAFGYDSIGTSATAKPVTGSLGVRVTRNPSEVSELDAIVAARIGASKTGSVLFDAGRLFKSGAPADFARLDRELSAELDRVARERRTYKAAGASGAGKAFDDQARALKSAQTKLRTTRGSRCACAPGDLQCALRCSALPAKPASQPSPSCAPGDPLCGDVGDLSAEEKAAAKDSVGASNPFKE